MNKPIIVLFVFLILSFLPSNSVFAQSKQENPVYIVQAGDTLSLIAIKFGISTNDLISANGIIDPNALNVGTELVIPGFPGISGVLVGKTIGFGESIRSISIQHNMQIESFIELNRITSPFELYAGNNLIVAQVDGVNPIQPGFLENGLTFLEIAAVNRSSPWTLAEINNKNDTWSFIPNDKYFHLGKNTDNSTNSLSAEITGFLFAPLPIVQGSPTILKITTNQPIEFSGTLGENKLYFFQTAQNQYSSLFGVSIQDGYGLSSLNISGINAANVIFEISQVVLIQSGGFVEDPPLIVDPTTIDPKTIKDEDVLISDITNQVTPEKLWSGVFQYPTDDGAQCVRSGFGNIRIYNGSYSSWHTGVDFGICASNLNIYADAPGIVVFTGPQVIRGNATIIDHGWGVFSGFWHQSEIFVKTGDRVEAGQLIGIIGNSGRSTGSHLHWEIRINGVPVNPLRWVENSYP